MTTLPVNSVTAQQAAPQKPKEQGLLPPFKTSTSLAFNTLEDVWRLGDALVRCGWFDDAKTAAQGFAKIMQGRELGLGPMASMRELFVTKNGKVGLSANLMAALIGSNPRYEYKIVEFPEDGSKCVIEFYRDGNLRGVSSLTMDQAAKAGMNMQGGQEKETWKRYPRNMLFARAMSNGFKWYVPELGNGLALYTPDELQDDAVEGDVRYVPLDESGEPVRPDLISAVMDPVKTIDRDKYDDVTGELKQDEVPASAFTPEEQAEAIEAGAVNDLEMPQDEWLPAMEQAAKALDPGATVREVSEGEVLPIPSDKLPATQNDLFSFVNAACKANGVEQYKAWQHLFNTLVNEKDSTGETFPITAPSKATPWTKEKVDKWTRLAIQHQKAKQQEAKRQEQQRAEQQK